MLSCIAGSDRLEPPRRWKQDLLRTEQEVGFDLKSAWPEEVCHACILVGSVGAVRSAEWLGRSRSTGLRST